MANHNGMEIPEGSFIQLPAHWVFELGADDLRRLMIVQWRFKYFADMAVARGQDVRFCYYESQAKMCELFGMGPGSRSRVSEFLKRMETGGYISVIRSTGENNKPRHYITVNCPILLAKYDLTADK